MNKETLNALKGSIKKWENIIQGTAGDQGSHNCPLCKVFIAGGCKKCPVALKTKRTDCTGTPYMEWAMATKDQWGRLSLAPSVGALAISTKEIAAAKAELNFLKSLLPKSEHRIKERTK